MSFLNPSVLIALAAVSIPVLIHLLNLRKIKKVEFSTLMFLREIQKSKMRRIRLKQLLLLLLRIMTIILLVLSFSKPVFDEYAGNSAMSSKSTVLIFLDDSFSMNARDNSGLYFTKAEESVRKILEIHKESSEIFFIPFSRIGLKNSDFLKNSPDEVLQELNGLKLSFKFTSMTAVLDLADDICASSKNELKEIYVISDFQKSNFSITGTESLQFENLNTVSAKTYLLNIGNREVNNLSLDSFKVITELPEKDKEIKIKINLNNFSQYNVQNKTVNLVIENEFVSSAAADAGSYSSNEVEFKFKINKSGNINGYFELTQNVFSEDELIQDNKYYFSVYIPEKFNVSLIEENNSPVSFLETAINSANDLLSDSSGSKNRMFIITREKTVSENIYKSDAVFISGKENFTDSEGEILRKYVSDGGGIFIFPGKNADIYSYNKILSGKLNSLILENLNSAKEENIYLKFEKIDFEHPVLSGVFRNQSLNITSQKFFIESPSISSYFTLLPGGNASALITLNNNRPFIAESKLSGGKILFSSVSAGNDFSDFPLKTIFLPLIIRSIYYLGNNSGFRNENIIGKSNLISVKGIHNVSAIILPDKKTENLKITGTYFESDENIFYLPYSEITALPGEYNLLDSAGMKFSFPLNCSPYESNTLKMSEEETEKYFRESGITNVKYIRTTDDITKIVSESRTGFGLWKYMLFGALIFLLAEVFLSKYLEKS
ncbi:MAG: BatA and WFA domain-containing protein [Bacteroidetes bacterium]|nr:BatA and WFA domain-containing protein [Bacteroidota bacterium]